MTSQDRARAHQEQLDEHRAPVQQMAQDVEIIQALASEALLEAFAGFEKGTSEGCRRGNELSEVFHNLCYHAFHRVWPHIDRHDLAVSEYVQSRYEQMWFRRYGGGQEEK